MIKHRLHSNLRQLAISPRLLAPSRTSSTSAATSKSPKTFYTLFPTSIPTGAPPRGPFTIDTRALQREFFQLQQKSHPDVLRPSASVPSSAYINKAYTTLKDPLLRSQYLLSLCGIDVAEDETMKVDDQTLLMEVLESQEEIEAARVEEDLLALKQVNEARVAQSLQVLERAFAEDDLETAKRETVRLRYWVNIRDTVNSWEKGKPVVLVH